MQFQQRVLSTQSAQRAILTNDHKRADVAHNFSQSMRKPTLMHLHLWAESSFVRQMDELFVKFSCSVSMEGTYAPFLSCTLSLQGCAMMAEADQHQGQGHRSGPWTAPDWESVQHRVVGGWMIRSPWVSTTCCPANPTRQWHNYWRYTCYSLGQ